MLRFVTPSGVCESHWIFLHFEMLKMNEKQLLQIHLDTFFEL